MWFLLKKFINLYSIKNEQTLSKQVKINVVGSSSLVIVFSFNSNVNFVHFITSLIF